jgi:hypothetical protein
VTLARVGGRSSFWGSVTARLCEQLLPGGAHSRSTTSWWIALLYNYFPVDVRGTALLPFFLHQLKIDYFEQLNMSTVGNGTASAFSTGPTSGYNLEHSRLFVVFFLFLYRLSVNTYNPYEAIIWLNNIIICLVTFGIKIYGKVPKFIMPWQCHRQHDSMAVMHHRQHDSTST